MSDMFWNLSRIIIISRLLHEQRIRIINCHFVKQIPWNSNKWTRHTQSETRLKCFGIVESFWYPIFNLGGPRVWIVTGPTPPWAFTIASECRARSKPSTWFPRQRPIECSPNTPWNISYFLESFSQTINDFRRNYHVSTLSSKSGLGKTSTFRTKESLKLKQTTLAYTI